ncbi:MAG: ATP-dependent helicase/nuclease subunit B [Candidatus Binatia bacterium]
MNAKDFPFEALPTSALFERIEAGALVLVPTNRLALDLGRRIERQLCAAQQSGTQSGTQSNVGADGASLLNGVSVCEAPPVERFEGWLARLWSDLGDDRVLLSPAAERARWEHVLVSDPETRDVDDPAQLARSAAAAWQVVCGWGDPEPEPNPTPEVRAYARWLNAFRGDLTENEFVTRSELPTLLGPILAANAERPAEIILLAFELIEPDRNAMLAALATAGTKVFVCDGASTEAGTVEVSSFADADEEIRSAAREIATVLRADPGARVGVVLTDLDTDRLAVERMFAEELDPEASLAGGSSRAAVIDVAGGIRLTDQAVVGHALDLLELGQQGNPFELVTRVLLAPYPKPSVRDNGGDTFAQAEARAVTEVALRDDHLRRVDLAQLQKRARDCGAIVFADNLQRYGQRLSGQPQEGTLADWCHTFLGDLSELGAFDIEPESRDRQALQRLREVIEEGAVLSPFLGPGLSTMSRDRALARVSELAADVRTQPPAEGAPVAVLELLDAAGLSWDRVWVLGMNDQVVPAPAQPSVLLPVVWQRANRVRRGSPEAELAFARERIRRLYASAPVLHVGWRRLGASGEELGPSPLIDAPTTAASTDSPHAPARPWYETEIPGTLEKRGTDTAVVPQSTRMNVTALQYVSACPFRGVAKLRWAAEPLEAIEAEPCARTRGIVVHDVMEAVYGQIGDAKTLAATTQATIGALAETAARKAITKGNTHPVPEWLHESLISWAKEMALAWTRYEREAREDDWKIHEREATHRGTVGAGLEVSGRVDRVDCLADGSLLIVDYKTAAEAKGDGEWKSGRPRDPQLPVYAAILASQATIGGLAFANLAARDDCSLKGLSAFPLAPKLAPPGALKSRQWPPDWEDALATMQGSVEAIAKTWLAGDVAVDPRPGVCRHCGLESLCRVFEQELDTDDEEDDA